MNRSEDRQDSVTDADSAVQQSHAPRPLPLFLELIRMESRTNPEVAAKALEGLARYEAAARPKTRPDRPAIATNGPAKLRCCGGDGATVVLIPSLINPPHILDLDEEVSLADAVAGMGRRVLLLDWGKANERPDLSLGGHIERLLVPLLQELDEAPAIIGYCLGGTMAVAVANLAQVECVVTLAAPWHFSGYPNQSRESLQRLWSSSRGSAEPLGALPIEVLQSAFWSLDPKRTVDKFARFAELPPSSDNARRFVTLEDWANEGEPLPLPAARELIEELFGRDLPGSCKWRVGGRVMTDRLDRPLLNITASNDRITPAATAPDGSVIQIDSGHVGMVVGSARSKLHEALRSFLG